MFLHYCKRTSKWTTWGSTDITRRSFYSVRSCPGCCRSEKRYQLVQVLVVDIVRWRFKFCMDSFRLIYIQYARLYVLGHYLCWRFQDLQIVLARLMGRFCCGRWKESVLSNRKPSNNQLPKSWSGWKRWAEKYYIYIIQIYNIIHPMYVFGVVANLVGKLKKRCLRDTSNMLPRSWKWLWTMSHHKYTGKSSDLQ